MNVWNKKQRTAPFDRDGNLAHFVHRFGDYDYQDVTEPFHSWVEIVKTDYNNNVVFRVDKFMGTGLAYMSFPDFFSMVCSRSIILQEESMPSIVGWWEVMKKGRSYFIRACEKDRVL